MKRLILLSQSIFFQVKYLADSCIHAFTFTVFAFTKKTQTHKANKQMSLTCGVFAVDPH